MFAFTSDPASWVGRGQSPTFTSRNASFQVGWDSIKVNVGVVPQGETAPTWRFAINPPSGQRLGPGTFNLAARASTIGVHGFEFSGGGNDCVSGSGTASIEDFSAPGFVERLRMSFTVQCSNTPAVNGRLVLEWVPGVGYR